MPKPHFFINRRGLIRWAVAALAILAAPWPAHAQDDPLPSWNDGAAKQAILDFVADTTTEGGADFVAPEDRIATFDQDGTTWVEHPLYGQGLFALDRLAGMAPDHPEWKDRGRPEGEKAGPDVPASKKHPAVGVHPVGAS